MTAPLFFADTCAKLKEGIDQKIRKKLVKFSFSFSVCLQVSRILHRTKIFVEGRTSRSYSETSKKRRTSREYLRDRQGLQSLPTPRVMKRFDEKSVKFIIEVKKTANLKK
ncbi:MAG: hypothetical protein U0T85_01490 [Cloacibacterium normanense]